jgi:hypothetical protein
LNRKTEYRRMMMPFTLSILQELGLLGLKQIFKKSLPKMIECNHE